MNPAFSVIFFTTASGAGYGLLAWLGMFNVLGLLPQGRQFPLAALVLAVTLVTAGLLSSMLHLGHPERAWRAFSQWRSSWLSREGVLALLTYVPALVLGWGFAWGERSTALCLGAGALAALCALATVFCTAMIYASLRSIDAWHLRHVPPLYLLLALGTGLLVFDALAACFGASMSVAAPLACVLLAAAALLKWHYWRALDSAAGRSSAESATGLGRFGAVSMLQSPHDRDNYVLREMGFVIARKHSRKLRRMTAALLFALPLLASLLAAHATAPLASGAAWVALAAAVPGVVVERWLFFAEARHSAGLFYGRR